MPIRSIAHSSISGCMQQDHFATSGTPYGAEQGILTVTLQPHPSPGYFSANFKSTLPPSTLRYLSLAVQRCRRFIKCLLVMYTRRTVTLRSFRVTWPNSMGSVIGQNLCIAAFVYSTAKRDNPCRFVQWRRMACRRWESASHDFQRLRVRLPVLADRLLPRRNTSLSFCRPHLYTPCNLLAPSFTHTFAYNVCTSAVARHVYEPEQAKDQDEDGDCEETRARHRSLVAANALHCAITTRPPDQQPEFFGAACESLQSHVICVCANKVAGTRATVACRFARAEAQGLAEHSTMGEQ